MICYEHTFPNVSVSLTTSGQRLDVGVDKLLIVAPSDDPHALLPVAAPGRITWNAAKRRQERWRCKINLVVCMTRKRAPPPSQRHTEEEIWINVERYKDRQTDRDTETDRERQRDTQSETESYEKQSLRHWRVHACVRCRAIGLQWQMLRRYTQ